jgi:hypothetical protein
LELLLLKICASAGLTGKKVVAAAAEANSAKLHIAEMVLVFKDIPAYSPRVKSRFEKYKAPGEGITRKLMLSRRYMGVSHAVNLSPHSGPRFREDKLQPESISTVVLDTGFRRYEACINKRRSQTKTGGKARL